jgi:hypothetical protein
MGSLSDRMKLLYRVDEVAEILSMSKRSVYCLLETGDLVGHTAHPGKRGLRVTGESIVAYIEKYKVKSQKVGEIGSQSNLGRKVPSKRIG